MLCPLSLGTYKVWEMVSHQVSLGCVQAPDCICGQVLYGLVIFFVVGRQALRITSCHSYALEEN